MFGLKNTRGSCWVNATLQALFRIPQVQKRYDALDIEYAQLYEKFAEQQGS
jgi:uncharacterized UBP type Zn finger protein